MPTSTTPASRRGSGIGAFLGVFVLVLLIEVVLDIFLLPADVVLVPAEVIGDALFFTVGIIGAWKGTSSNSGRQIGGPKRAVRGSRRGTLRFHHNRRAIGGGQVGMIAGVWLLFAAVLGFQWWWSIHHPYLQIITLPFELAFDVLGILVSVVVTVFALTGTRPGAGPSPEVGA